MKQFFVVLLISALLTACGESPEEAYTRGYDEGFENGIDEVCSAVSRISLRFHDRLVSERVCF